MPISYWSKGHFYDLDFTPTDEWTYENYTDGFSYTDYVANVFQNLEHISSRTDTAGALERVRTEDIIKTRNGTTYVMVFTDGESNSFNDTVDQAELLHTLVDEVFAFGIGDNINVDELEAIASKDSNMDIMENFQSYRDYISQFILRQGGCNTRQIRPYRAIEFNRPRLTLGLSWETALNSNLSSCKATTVCSNEKEIERKPVCSQCSMQLAEIDLEAMEMYRENITTAATNKCFNAALLAGLISQQSRGGALLDQNGTMPCSNRADGLCYGIMGMKNEMNVDDGIGGINYLEAGIDQLIALIDEIVARHSAWTIVQQTRAGIAAWEVGINQILSHERIDYFTANKDMSSDVLARASFFAQNGY